MNPYLIRCILPAYPAGQPPTWRAHVDTGSASDTSFQHPLTGRENTPLNRPFQLPTHRDQAGL